MRQRGVSKEQVASVVAGGEAFRYYHHGHWETGYYDADSGLFVAADRNIVITVITDVGRGYIDRLKAARP
ncbi:MAG: hypothetical protein KGO96_00580 [Elusimicrobia bacterium]|nr:hypothetical protein [Elusimicrobiota bacterium]MDE2238170.1 hypothetical protein [Elusimicrobiota bacterium]MDE2424389.1 hypothetical protein [Elusimicrobiota bacterium]